MIEVKHNCQNPEKFTTELKFLNEKLYYKFYPVKTFFSTQYSDFNFNYNKQVKQYKENINKLAKPLQAKVEKELINIHCVVTDGKDTKNFTEQLISDNAIETMKNYYEIGRYNDCVRALKSGSYCTHFLMPDKNSKEYKNVMLVTDILVNAKDLLIASPINEQNNKFISNCIQTLYDLLPIKTTLLNGIMFEEFAYNLAEISKQKVNQLNFLNRRIKQNAQKTTLEKE